VRPTGYQDSVALPLSLAMVLPPGGIPTVSFPLAHELLGRTIRRCGSLGQPLPASPGHAVGHDRASGDVAQPVCRRPRERGRYHL